MTPRWFQPITILLVLSTTTVGSNLQAQTDSTVRAWVGRLAVPLQGTSVFDAKLSALVSTADVVGLGESVHGIEDFSAYRIAVLKRLIQHDRVTAVVLETGMPEATLADRYVRGETTTLDYRAALGGEFAASPSFHDFLVWLREWNEGAGRGSAVGIYGVDASIGDGATMVPALDLLGASGNADIRRLVDSIRPIALRVAAPWWGAAAKNYQALSDADRTGLTSLITQLIRTAEQSTDRNRDARQWDVQLARLLRQDQTILANDQSSGSNPRDLAMAENVLWLYRRLAPGQRAAVLTHDAHVQKTLIVGQQTPPGGVPNMGQALAAQLGARYLAIGTTYGGPAVDNSSAPLPEAIDSILSNAAPAPFMIDLRELARHEEIAAWGNAVRPMRFQTGYLSVAPWRAFDVLVHFDHVAAPAKQRSPFE